MNNRIQLVLMIGFLVSATAGAEPWTLERAVTQALVSSPDARMAAQRIAAAQAGLRQAQAAFSPQLQFQASYLRTDNPMMVFGSILNQRSFSSALDFNDVPDIDNANFKGLLTMPLYAGGRNTASRDAARAHTAAAREMSSGVRNALAFEVVRAYHNVLKTREFIRATEAGVTAFETNRANAIKRQNTGTLLRADVLDLEVRSAQAREESIRARNAHALALRNLRNLIGIEEGEIEVADGAPALGLPGNRNHLSRPELAASGERQRAAEAEVRRASSGHKPRVSAFGSLDYDYGTRTDSEGGSYSAGVLMQWDLWDGLLTKARKDEARANLETTREEDRKLRLALDLELEQARIALREATERLAVTEAVISQAAESAQLTRSRFEGGLALPTQLIDAETALVAARVRRAEAEADRSVAVAAIRKAVGLPQIESSNRP